MATFEAAIPVILAHEGGLVDHPADPGGLTNRGITMATWRRVRGEGATEAELRALTEAGATEIYRSEYWSSIYDLIDNQNVATKVFDMAVNMGHRQAHLLLQRACTACGFRLAADGLFGTTTLAAVNCAVPEELVLELCYHQAAFYRGLTNVNPGMIAFLGGWLERAKWPFDSHEAPTKETVA
jgi:type VI secretion system secreted protein VgrG